MGRGSRKLRVLVSGPLPPPLGGMGTYCADYLQTSLVDEFDVRFRRSRLIGLAHRTRGLVSVMFRILNALCITAAWLFSLLFPRPDVVHIHTCSYAGFFVRAGLIILAKLLCIPTVLHIHGGRFHEFYESSSRFGRWLIRHLIQMSDRVIVLSDQWFEFYTSIGIPPERLLVIRNSVNIPPEPASGPSGGDRVVGVFMALFADGKGVHEIVKAVDQSEMLKSRCRIVMAGPESPAWHAVAAAIQERSLGEVIELPGPKIGDEKDSAFRESDFFLLPSHAEGLPIGLLEAMSYGLPCITTPVGGIPDVVRDEENGILITPGDVDALQNAIERLIEDESLRARLGSAARETMQREYSWDQRVVALGNMYRELAGCDAGPKGDGA
jgi:glycosyltransferase involved in cell wall biosynthesis